MRAVFYERSALVELEQEVEWYDRRAPGAGRRLVELVEAKVASIRETPESFPIDARHPRARRALLGKRRYPFSIVFVLREDDAIVIVAVAHAKRRPGYWFRRLDRVSEPRGEREQ